MELELEAGTIRVKSSAYFRKLLRGEAQRRSDEIELLLTLPTYRNPYSLYLKNIFTFTLNITIKVKQQCVKFGSISANFAKVFAQMFQK